MYTDKQITEMFKDKYNTIDSQCKEYLDAYINIYKQSFIRPCESDKFNHHHFFPSFIFKQLMGEKNSYHTIEKLDESYKPSDNVCKLRILYHVLAHYYLALAMKGTVYEFDANNAFYTLVGNYSKNINNYTLEEVKELGRLIEENAQPNSINHYVTQNERKELYKEQQKEYKKKWKEEHADEIEERKRKQREYVKKMREEFKKNAKNKRS